nr:MAG TPA: hypothetical protein [Caudoviricetes sp.]
MPTNQQFNITILPSQYTTSLNTPNITIFTPISLQSLKSLSHVSAYVTAFISKS